MINAAIFLALLGFASAIPIDNGVEGDPEIECGAQGITVSFNTRNPFEGRVYVKGLFNQAGCRSEQTGGRVASINLPFDSCNVQRTRSLNPAGLFVGTTVIISFHPHFETKVDRAYRVQCFYMEADKTVSAELEVSMLTTAFQTQIVPMPVCRYEILDGGPSGAPIRYAIIGQQVYHKWTCDTETVDTFCMRVHSCFVDDGAGDKVTLLNEEGCAQDRYLLRNLEYTTDLMAGQEAHVFKYADRAQLFFQCQIAITIKEPNSQCVHPTCADPAGFGAVSGGTISAPAPAPGGRAPAPASGSGSSSSRNTSAPAAGSSSRASAAPSGQNGASGQNGGSASSPAPAPSNAPAPAASTTHAPAPAPSGNQTGSSATLVEAFLRKRRAPEAPARPSPADRDQDARMIDVVAEIQALDLDEKQTAALPNDLLRRPSNFFTPSYVSNSNSDGFCLSSTGFGLLIAFVICLFVSAAVTMAIFCARRQNSKE